MATTPNLNLIKLTSLKANQLTLLFKDSSAGAIPLGDSNGRAMFLPGTAIGAALSWLGNRRRTMGRLAR